MKRLFVHQLAALLSVFGTSLTGAVMEQEVFFDVPEELAAIPIPSPSSQLAALPGYPDDADRLPLVARLYVPDPALHGSGPYPAVVILHGSGGL